jgi:hypothetical protein
MAHERGITPTPQCRQGQVLDAFGHPGKCLFVFFPTLQTLLAVLLNTHGHPNGKTQSHGKKEQLQRTDARPVPHNTA